MTRAFQTVLAGFARRDATAPLPRTAGSETNNESWRAPAAAAGLALAGVAAPIAVAAVATASGRLGPPLVASALIALLVLAPAGVGLATAMSGLRRVAAVLRAVAAVESEHAILRVLVNAVLFGCSLAAAAAARDPATPYLPIAGLGLIAAWCLLLHIVLWPSSASWRSWGAMALDVVLLSLLLHFGDAALAGWYPLYLLAILYAGLRYGVGALVGMATGSLCGFAIVELTTDLWRDQPMLATGLLCALAVLPAAFYGVMRAATGAQDQAAEAQRRRGQLLRLVADSLRAPIEALQGAVLPADAGAPDYLPGTVSRLVRLVCSRIDELMTLAAVEAGDFAPPVETFDLRRLAKDALAPVEIAALEKHVALRWRIDATLPFRLRGRAEAVRSLLTALAGHAVAEAQRGPVRIGIGEAGGDGRRLRLVIRLETPSGDSVAEEPPLSLHLVRRLTAMLGGDIRLRPPVGNRILLEATVPLGVEEGSAATALDLDGRPVLIASEDSALAAQLAELVGGWGGTPHPLAAAEAAAIGDIRIGEIRGDLRPVLIIDGRERLLSALSAAHRAASMTTEAPFVLLLADSAQTEKLDALDGGEIDGFVPAPLTPPFLANALIALPFDRARPPRPRANPQTLRAPADTADESVTAAGRITPIADHPRFAADGAVSSEAGMTAGLRIIGGDPGFMRDLVDAFRADAQQTVTRIEEAIAAGDGARFSQAVAALRRGAGQLGGARLLELLNSAAELTPAELRQQGQIHLRRLRAEIDRLAAALADAVPAAERQ